MKKFLILMLAAFLLIPISSYSSEKIIIGADNWCPFNCNPKDVKPGYMIEIAKKAFKNSGIEVEYKIIPWARALQLCRQGEINGIIGAYKSDAPDFIFPENELGMIDFAIFTKKDSSWIYKNTDSLANISLGVIRDYSYSDEIDAYINKNYSETNKIQIMSGDSPLEKNIKKLAADRIDATIEADPVFQFTASELKMQSQFRKAGSIALPEKAYIAFSPEIEASRKYADILSSGIEKLRKSGELKVILEKYGLNDWK